MTASLVWNASSVAALDAIVTMYEARGAHLELRGTHEYTGALHVRLSGVLGQVTCGLRTVQPA